jgi:HSP20 family protein
MRRYVMAIIRWRGDVFDPVHEFSRLRSEIDRLFDLQTAPTYQGLFDRTASPAVDVLESTDKYTVLCDLPGVDQKDLELSIASGILTIKGEKKTEDKKENAKVYRKQTWQGSFQRTISLPDLIDADHVEAVLKNGVLRLIIPKREEAKAKRIELKKE